jgi:hypothetical protein
VGLKTAANKGIGSLSALSAALSAASAVWLLLYRFSEPARAWRLILVMALCLLVELGGWVGVRFFPEQHIWPGACMLLAAPAAFYSGVAGPGTLLNFSYGIIGEMMDGLIFDPLYYVALPGMVVGIGCAIALVFVGIMWLADDLPEALGYRRAAAKAGPLKKAPPRGRNRR